MAGQLVLRACDISRGDGWHATTSRLLEYESPCTKPGHTPRSVELRCSFRITFVQRDHLGIMTAWHGATRLTPVVEVDRRLPAEFTADGTHVSSIAHCSLAFAAI